jgi:hypothetical protein
MGCGASDFVRAPGGSGRRDISRGPLLPAAVFPQSPLGPLEDTSNVRR